MFFLEIISWKDVSCFNRGGGGGEEGRGRASFQMGGASFLSGGAPHGGGIGFG